VFPERVAVLGAGTMGVGIALVFALAGARVNVRSRRQETLDRAAAEVESRLAASGVHPAEREGARSRLTFTAELPAALAGANLVVETIPEDAADKHRLLAEVEEYVADDTIVTTNTSSLPIGDLARVLRRPERFAGLHWFNPPELMRLVEIVSGPETAETTVETLAEWSRRAGHRPIRVRRDVPGFVFNRLQYALIREAYALVASGVATFDEIDEVVTAGLGPRWAAIGPFESMDLAGLDVHLTVAGRLFPELDASTEPPADLAALVGDGALGAKTGRGLRGAYDDARVDEIVRRRAETLAAFERRR
jgi:3-hydroxybutyryl-CoA dehydrogenase